MTRTVLCIDDDPETLSLRKEVLQSSAFTVLTALSGREGLNVLADGRMIDIVVLDYFMPEMKGDQVAWEIKKLYPGLPIVLMSGFPDLPPALLEVADRYVPKGEDPETLLQSIEEILENRRK